MKRCPECRRDYYDDTLLYCLDDGNALLEGPASADEPATAIMPANTEGIRSKASWFNKKLVVVSIVILAVFLIAAVGFGIYRFAESQKTNISFESAKITRLTNSGKVTNKTAISPDGKWLVYAIQDGERQSLWLKQVAIPDSNTQIVQPASLEYTGLAFSPDGNYLYYTVVELGAATGTLYQVPVLGGTARKLFTGIWDKVSFSPDGKQIVYFNYIDDEDILMIAKADGTAQRQLAVRRGNEFFNIVIEVASWSPDGKTIATTVGTLNPEFMSVAAVSVATGEIDLFCQQKFGWTGDVNWLADGKSVLVLASEYSGQAQKIWQISYPSGEAKKISNDLSSYEVISLTTDSNALATVQSVITSNIWSAPVNDTAHATQVTSGSDQNDLPSWTGDGKLVYTRNSNGIIDLFIVDAGGGSPKQLTSNSDVNIQPAVSPDGRYVIFVSNRTGTDSLWRMDIDGSNPKQLTNASDSNPSFSPDGREIIFQRNTNKQTIWKVGIGGGEPVQLTDKESVTPVFSPDGKQFACVQRENPQSPYKLTIFPSIGGSPVKSFAQPLGFNAAIRWMADGRSIAYVVDKGDVGNIWTQGLDGGPPKQITNFTNESIRSFDFSRDGKQIAVSRGTQTSDVVLISGFRK